MEAYLFKIPLEFFKIQAHFRRGYFYDNERYIDPKRKDRAGYSASTRPQGHAGQRLVRALRCAVLVSSVRIFLPFKRLRKFYNSLTDDGTLITVMADDLFVIRGMWPFFSCPIYCDGRVEQNCFRSHPLTAPLVRICRKLFFRPTPQIASIGYSARLEVYSYHVLLVISDCIE